MGSHHMQTAQTTRHSLTMDARIVFPTTLLIFICLFANSSCLQCVQCNSVDDARCDDPFSQELKGDYLHHCPDDGKEYFCQKTVYEGNGEHRVKRSCQHLRIDPTEELCFNGEHTVICECERNGCNSGSQLKVSLFAIVSAAVLGYLRH